MSIYNDISNKLDELHDKIRPDNLDWLKEAKETFSIFIKGEKIGDFIRALECVEDELAKDKAREKELKEVRGLLKSIQTKEPDYLIENLRRVGYAIANRHTDLRDAINKEALRILEQTRLGKRDAVIHMLMRNFIVRQIHMPIELIDALKPQYDVNQFRAFIYAFLSAFITESKEEGNE